MFLNDSLAETKWWIESGLLSCHVIQLVGLSVQTVKIIHIHIHRTRHLQAKGTDTSPSL